MTDGINQSISQSLTNISILCNSSLLLTVVCCTIGRWGISFFRCELERDCFSSGLQVGLDLSSGERIKLESWLRQKLNLFTTPGARKDVFHTKPRTIRFALGATKSPALSFDKYTKDFVRLLLKCQRVVFFFVCVCVCVFLKASAACARSLARTAPI